MKVGINSLSLSLGHTSRGIGVYTRNLIAALMEEGVEVEEFATLKELGRVDVVHYPFFDLSRPTLLIPKGTPTVVTIHDVTPLVFPQHYPLGIKGKVALLRQKISLRKAAAVITDSLNSKQDIEKYLGVADERIFPIHLAASDKYKLIKDQRALDLVKKKYDLPEKFVIYIGDVNWNKNLLGVGQGAMAANIDLVLVGKSFENRANLSHPEMNSFKDFLEQFGDNPRVHILGFVADEDLVGVLNLSSVLLLPSFYEGFGLSILEAQACGVPVVTSPVSSIPEVAGDGALYVDPYDSQQIAQSINRIIKDATLADKLVAAGLKNSQKFSWRLSAKRTIEVYQNVASR